MIVGAMHAEQEVAAYRGWEFLRGGGEMGRRIRATDWSSTPLGDPAQWPRGLKTAVRIMLTSRQQKFVWWGPELINLYNDHYAPALGARHPQALGRPAAEVWTEIWDQIGPRARRVLSTDEGTFDESLPLVVERNGYPEEAFFTFSYSPIPGDDGRPGGIICACIEETRRIVGERQLALLHALANRMSSARNAAEACTPAAQCLDAHRPLVSFALLYLWHGSASAATLAGCAGLPAGSAAAPHALPPDGAPWRLARSLRGRWQIVDLARRGIAAGTDARRARYALQVPIIPPGQSEPAAVLVVGLDPYRPFDEQYRAFIELIAGQIGAGLANAQAYDAQLATAQQRELGMRHEHELRTDAEVLLDLVQELGGELDLERLVQKITEVGVRLTGATCGTFFYTTVDADGASRVLHALCGAAAAALAGLGTPRTTAPSGAAASAASAFRCADVSQRPEYARGGPRNGMTDDQPPVRSYLAVPVMGRNGKVLGGLSFGHPQADVFGERAERLALGIAAQAAVVIDNAHAYQDAQRAIERSIRSERAYRNSDRRNRQLINAMPVAVYCCDVDGALTQYNRAAAALWGREPEIGRDRWCGAHEIFSPETGAPIALQDCPMAIALRERRAIYGAEVVVGRSDGTRRHVLVYPRPLYGEDGAVSGAINILVDITEQKQKEAALRRSEQLYRAIGESIDYGVWLCDAQGRCTYASDSFLQLVGMTRAQCNELGWTDALHPDDREATIAAWQACVAAGANWDCEHRVRGRDGGWHPVLARGVALRDERGEVSGWAGINLDIERLKRVEHELRESDRRKNELLAILAHELRNPLAPIRSGLEVLQRAEPGGATAAQALRMMERQVANMVRLVDDLLDLSRITRGLVELRRAPLDVREPLRNAVEACRALIEAAGHQLRVEIRGRPARVNADSTRLEQVFVNLLNNAVRYTPPRGLIRVSAASEGEHVAIRVADNGIGISADMRERIFEMFARADRALEHGSRGLGIGLTLVQRLVAMHGGTVEVRSEGSGRGAEFVVRLPRLEAARAWAPRAAEASAQAQPRAAGEGPPRRVLIVDDHVDAADSMALLLSMRGDEVRVVHNGVEAIAETQHFRPHAILMDIGMPQLNGYEACRRIRETDAGRDIVIVAITGWGQAEDKRRSSDAGFDLHWVKPVGAQQLDGLLQQLRTGVATGP